MDWILFVFKKGDHHYLVSSESINQAWEDLSIRQSISVENCKKQYKYLGHMNGVNKNVWKI